MDTDNGRESSLGKAGAFLSNIDPGMRRLIAIGVVETLAVTLYASLLAPWYKSLGYESAAQGWLAFVVQLTSALVAIAGGILADRLGRKRMYVTGQIIRCAVPVFLLLTKSYLGLIIVSLLRGLTLIQKPAENAFVGAYTEQKNRATLMSIHQTAYLLAAMVGPMTAGFLADLYGVKIPMVLGLVLAVAAIIIAIPLKDPLETEQDASDAIYIEQQSLTVRSFFSGVKELFSQPNSPILVMLLIASLANGLGNGAVNILLPFTVMDRFSSGYTAVTALSLFSSLGTVLVILIGGRIADIKGRRGIILISGSIFPVIMISMLWISELWQVYAVLLLITMVGNISSPAMQALNIEVVEPKYLATWSGFLMCASSLGMGVGSILGGFMYRLNPDLAWIVTVILFALSVVCYYFVLKPKPTLEQISA
ncbi:MAG TPA: MFS transporter [Bacillota bacterium]|nr:MFS transporter [Candidatus Fermentithermobacillaceae bacterium]HOB31018.1 MFS transporter [Bacillota bacterium]HOK64833.1 MFS transporter [Bacillota bacterium]HOL12484.1 MFS transporter [Bacillota bacterium]HOQ03420.1 MFS transporter [Bacillota bacterium]